MDETNSQLFRTLSPYAFVFFSNYFPFEAPVLDILIYTNSVHSDSPHNIPCPHILLVYKNNKLDVGAAHTEYVRFILIFQLLDFMKAAVL